MYELKMEKEQKDIKNVKKSLKNASFWVINSKKKIAPPSANLFVGLK